MGLLKNVGTNQNDPEIKELMDNIVNAVGTLPKPLAMMAASPGLFKKYYSSIGYYAGHEKLSAEFLLFLRYVVARKMNFPACVDFNGGLLIKQGMSEEGLEEIVLDYKKIPLEVREQELINFVLKGLADQTAATQNDIEKLNDMGWAESDILDAANQGFAMLAPGYMLKYFKLLD